MLKVGVLALQGSVVEHINALNKIEGVMPSEVRTLADLNEVSGLILPGGESTTLGKLMREFGLLDTLKRKIADGMPVWGTCAGLILLANKISDEDIIHIGMLDAVVRRNAYGSQLDSFVINEIIPEISPNKQKLVFIRAPWIEAVSKNVRVIAEHAGKIIAVRQKNIFGTTFHPELTEDASFHEYFVNMCRNKELN